MFRCASRISGSSPPAERERETHTQHLSRKNGDRICQDRLRTDAQTQHEGGKKRNNKKRRTRQDKTRQKREPTECGGQLVPGRADDVVAEVHLQVRAERNAVFWFSCCCFVLFCFFVVTLEPQQKEEQQEREEDPEKPDKRNRTRETQCVSSPFFFLSFFTGYCCVALPASPRSPG